MKIKLFILSRYAYQIKYKKKQNYHSENKELFSLYFIISFSDDMVSCTYSVN